MRSPNLSDLIRALRGAAAGLTAFATLAVIGCSPIEFDQSADTPDKGQPGNTAPFGSAEWVDHVSAAGLEICDEDARTALAYAREEASWWDGDCPDYDAMWAEAERESPENPDGYFGPTYNAIHSSALLGDLEAALCFVAWDVGEGSMETGGDRKLGPTMHALYHAASLVNEDFPRSVLDWSGSQLEPEQRASEEHRGERMLASLHHAKQLDTGERPPQPEGYACERPIQPLYSHLPADMPPFGSVAWVDTVSRIAAQHAEPDSSYSSISDAGAYNAARGTQHWAAGWDGTCPDHDKVWEDAYERTPRNPGMHGWPTLYAVSHATLLGDKDAAVCMTQWRSIESLDGPLGAWEYRSLFAASLQHDAVSDDVLKRFEARLSEPEIDELRFDAVFDLAELFYSRQVEAGERSPEVDHWSDGPP